MKPKYQLVWNDNNSQLKIMIKYDKPIIIEPIQRNGEKVQENQQIGIYKFENQQKNITSTINGYIYWCFNSNEFEINPIDQFQTFGIIYKNIIDIPKYNNDEIEFNSSSSSTQTNITKLNFLQMGNINCLGKIKIEKWKVNQGDYVSPQLILGICIQENNPDTYIDLKCKFRGKIIELAKTKVFYQKEDTLLLLDGLEICKHLKIENNICIFCKEQIIRKDEGFDLNYTDDMLQKISKEIVLDILHKRKLILVLDLDQTILHAIKIGINFNRKEFCQKSNLLQEEQQYNGFGNLKYDIKEHFLELFCDQQSKFIIKLRPYIEQFFQTLIPLFDIYIYTKASRSYADFILGYIGAQLDKVLPEYKPFFTSNRIFSRDETICTSSKSLNRLFYPGIATNLLVILDDNPGMWSKFKDNLIHTKPFNYFKEHSNQKDGQGINVELEKEIEIANKFDCWLFTITEKLKEISEKFWKQVDVAKNDPTFKLDYENQNYKSKKIKLNCKDEINVTQNNQIEERTLLDLIINRNISAPKLYSEIRSNILKGITLFFAISEAHEETIKKGLEDSKEKAYYLGAKIFREFKESEFLGIQGAYIITVGRRKIKSILIAMEKQIPIIHYKWIEDCDSYLYRVDYKQYIEDEKGNNQHIIDESIRDQIIKNHFFKI